MKIETRALHVSGSSCKIHSTQTINQSRFFSQIKQVYQILSLYFK